jgi:hypothetical protein
VWVAAVVHPALDDLDAIEVGADRGRRCSTPPPRPGQTGGKQAETPEKEGIAAALLLRLDGVRVVVGRRLRISLRFRLQARSTRLRLEPGAGRPGPLSPERTHTIQLEESQ